MTTEKLTVEVQYRSTGDRELARFATTMAKLDIETQRTNRALSRLEQQQRRNQQTTNAASEALRRNTVANDNAVRSFANLNSQTNQMRASFQNAGYQVQDFAVQVGGGTKATVALGQQLPQLTSAMAGVFDQTSRVGRLLGGPWGVAIGIAAAVLVPLISKLTEAGDAAKEMGEKAQTAMDRLRESLNTQSAVSDAMTEATGNMITAQAAYARAVENTAKAQSTFRKVAALGEDISGAQVLLEQAKKREQAAKAALESSQKGYQSALADAKTVEIRARNQSRLDALNRESRATSRGSSSAGPKKEDADEAKTAAERIAEAWQKVEKAQSDAREELIELDKIIAKAVGQPKLVEWALAQKEALENELNPALAATRAELDQMAEAQAKAKADFDKTVATYANGGPQVEKLRDELEDLTEIWLALYELNDGSASFNRGLEVLEGQIRDTREALDEALAPLTKFEAQMIEVGETIINDIGGAFNDWINGTKTFADAMEDMGRRVVAVLAEMALKFAVLEIFKSLMPGSRITSGLTKAFGFANGGAFEGGVQKFAAGGVVNSPTSFLHSGGVGVMGEAGPEAIMPLKRGKDGKLGVSGGTNVYISNYSNNEVSVSDSERGTEIEIRAAQRAKRELTEEVVRGGSTFTRALEQTYGNRRQSR